MIINSMQSNTYIKRHWHELLSAAGRRRHRRRRVGSRRRHGGGGWAGRPSHGAAGWAGAHGTGRPHDSARSCHGVRAENDVLQGAVLV